MRNTKARSQIIDIFSKSLHPLAALDLIKRIKVNKTTIYRELDSLLKNKIIQEVDFGDGKKRYESTALDHHHHLICLTCNKVSDVEVEENFKLPTEFKIVKHNLEFFGYCSNCS